MFYGRLLWKRFTTVVYEIQGENKECRYSNECNCSYYGLAFIACKYNGMNKRIVCTLLPLFAGVGGGVGLSLQSNFQKGGLDRTSTFRGGLLGKGGDFFREGEVQLTHKNKLKSDIFNDKKSL